MDSRKYHDEAAKEEALWYGNELAEEIERDRAAHGKRPLKDIDETGGGEDARASEAQQGRQTKPKHSRKKQARRKKEKHVKVSDSDPESGWFRKGETRSPKTVSFRITQQTRFWLGLKAGLFEKLWSHGNAAAP